MGSLQDALTKSGLATEEQIVSAQREKAEKERLDKARREAEAVKRRERELEASLPQFIKDAIEHDRHQVELYVERSEKHLGQLPRRIRAKILKLARFDALMVLGTALTLHGAMMTVGEGMDQDKVAKQARERALDAIYSTLRKLTGENP